MDVSAPFPFEPVLLFGFLSLLLLIGIFLRARLSFLQRFLFPSCLVGGILGLIVMHTGHLPFFLRLVQISLKGLDRLYP